MELHALPLSNPLSVALISILVDVLPLPSKVFYPLHAM
jgi:hypothetical protein